MFQTLPKYIRNAVDSPLFLSYFALVITFCLLLGVFLLYRSTPLPEAGENSESYSLLGHRAFRLFAERIGYSVWVRKSPYGALPEGGVVFFIAPMDFPRFWKGLSQGVPRLRGAVFSPSKWSFWVDSKNPSWVRECFPKGSGKAEAFFQKVAQTLKFPKGHFRVSRISEGKAKFSVFWKGNPQKVFQLELDRALVFRKWPLGGKVVAATSRGALVLEYSLKGKKGQKLRCFFIADSDVFANGYIGKGENADFVATFLEYVAGEEKEFIIDEACHLLDYPQSLLSYLFQSPYTFPLLVHSILLVFLWGLWQIFSRHPQKSLLSRERSRQEQVETAGYLTYAAGHHAFFLRQYLVFLIHHVGRKFPWLEELSFQEKVKWLSEYERQRGNFPYHIVDLLEAVDEARKRREIELLLKRIKKWKESIDDSAGKA